MAVSHLKYCYGISVVARIFGLGAPKLAKKRGTKISLWGVGTVNFGGTFPQRRHFMYNYIYEVGMQGEPYI